MVMDETYVINQLKEELCYVSTDFFNDMKIAKYFLRQLFFHILMFDVEMYSYFRMRNDENSIVRDYVLPDYANIRKGYAKSKEESTGKPSDSEQVTNNILNISLQVNNFDKFN